MTNDFGQSRARLRHLDLEQEGGPKIRQFDYGPSVTLILAVEHGYYGYRSVTINWITDVTAAHYTRVLTGGLKLDSETRTTMIDRYRKEYLSLVDLAVRSGGEHEQSFNRDCELIRLSLSQTQTIAWQRIRLPTGGGLQFAGYGDYNWPHSGITDALVEILDYTSSHLSTGEVLHQLTETLDDWNVQAEA